MGVVYMGEEMKLEQGTEKIILPKDIQVEMMKFFLRTSIPKKKQLQEEQQKQALQSTPSDGSDT